MRHGSGSHCRCAVDGVGRCPHRLLGSRALTLSAGAAAVAPTWQTTASYAPLANVSAVSCAPSASRKFGDLRGRRRRRWQRGLRHRDPERRRDLVRFDSSSRRDHAFHRLVPVVSCLLRRRRCGNHEVDATAARAGRFRIRRFQPNRSPASRSTNARPSGDSRSSRTTDGSTWNPQTRAIGTELSCRASRVRTQSRASRSESSTSSPSIVGTQDGATWTTLDQPSVTSLTVVSCCWIDYVRCSRRRHGWWSNLAQHCGPQRPGLPTASIPSGSQLELRRLPERNHLHRRRHQPQLDPLRHRHLEQRLDLVAPDPTQRTQSISPGSPVLLPKTASPWETRATSGLAPRSWARRRAVCRGQRRTPPPGTSRLNSVSCPTTADCFAVGVELGSRLGQRRVRLEPHRPFPSDVDGLNGISCVDDIRLHGGGLRHLREPGHHRDRRTRARPGPPRPFPRESAS